MFVATWNAGGVSPHAGLNLDDFLQVDHQSDIYVLGYCLYSLSFYFILPDFRPEFQKNWEIIVFLGFSL